MATRKSKNVPVLGVAKLTLPALLLAAVFAPTSCLSPTTVHYTPSQALTDAGGTVATSSGGVCAPASGSFALCAAPAQVLHLGVSKAFNVNLVAAGDFEGDVGLNIERTDLDLVDTKATVTTQLNMAQLHLSPGQTVSVPVMVASMTTAPTVNSHFRLIASRMGGPAATSSSDVSLQIQPIYDVYLHGGAAPETWDANPPGTVTKFAPHTAGVTINFYNMDTASTHIIHGAGVVPHQNTAQPLAKSPGGGVAGGLYTVKLTQTTALAGSFYCHVHEGSNVARQVLTNQP